MSVEVSILGFRTSTNGLDFDFQDLDGQTDMISPYISNGAA
jgi:hypothetical protein